MSTQAASSMSAAAVLPESMQVLMIGLQTELFAVDVGLVREILDLARARAQPLQSLEQVVELPLVDRDATDLALGFGRRGLDLPQISHRHLNCRKTCWIVYRNRIPTSIPSSAAKRGVVQTGMESSVTVPCVTRPSPSARPMM